MGFWKTLADAAKPGQPRHRRNLESVSDEIARMQDVGRLLDTVVLHDPLTEINRACEDATRNHGGGD